MSSLYCSVCLIDIHNIAYLDDYVFMASPFIMNHPKGVGGTTPERKNSVETESESSVSYSEESDSESEPKPKRIKRSGSSYSILDPRTWCKSQSFYDDNVKDKSEKDFHKFTEKGITTLREDHEDSKEDIESSDLSTEGKNALIKAEIREFKEKDKAFSDFFNNMLHSFRLRDKLTIAKVLQTEREKAGLTPWEPKASASTLPTPVSTPSSPTIPPAIQKNEKQKGSPIDYVVEKMDTEMPSYNDPED